MSLVLTQEGGVLLWQYLLGILPSKPAVVHLIGKPHTASHADTQSTLAAVEASGGGYAPINLTGQTANWGLAEIVAGATASYIQLSFPVAAGTTIYGYWLSDQANQYSMFAETFVSPITTSSLGEPFLLDLMAMLTSPP